MIQADMIQTNVIPPSCVEDIVDKVVYYGNFVETLSDITSFFRLEDSSAAILRGDPGSGRKTLLKAAEETFLGMNLDKSKPIKVDKSKLAGLPVRQGLKIIYLSPDHYTDDYSALRHIGLELGLKIRPSINEIMKDIAERRGIDDKRKIVIVLTFFEEFCRQKQTLLYCLTNLTQNGKNINLLGVTSSLDCTRGLEKRVRSRLNALFYELKAPYRNREEYLEFASLLLGGYKITGKLKEALEELYIYGTRAIIHLKRYLISVCDWNCKGKLIVKQPEDSMIHYIADGKRELEDIIGSLTRSQLDLLVLAITHYNDKKSNTFTLHDLLDYKMKSFKKVKLTDAENQITIRNTAILAKVSLIRSEKPHPIITRHTKFALEVSVNEIKDILENNPEYRSYHENMKKVR